MTKLPNEAVDSLRGKLPPEDFQALTRWIGATVEREVARAISLAHLENSGSHLGLTDQVRDMLLRLSDESNLAPHQVLFKSLGLFKIALDAAFEGNRLAILGQDDDIVQEIVGIDAPAPVAQAIGG